LLPGGEQADVVDDQQRVAGHPNYGGLNDGDNM